jgi:hypothetical protein
MKAVTLYQDDAGNTHETRDAATIGDLAHIIGQKGDGPEGHPNIARIIFENRQAVMAALEAYEAGEQVSALTVIDRMKKDPRYQQSEIAPLKAAVQ